MTTTRECAWIECDPMDESKHPKDGSEIEIQSADGRIFVVFWTGEFTGSVDWDHLMPPEVAEGKIRWRYAVQSYGGPA
jgi:hypothetical protein